MSMVKVMFPNGIGTRAMLALIVIATTCFTLSYLAIAFKSEAALTALAGLAGSVVTWYFAKREEAAQAARATPVADPANGGGGDA